MRLERRIWELETRFLADPEILHFADGSTRELRGKGDYLLCLSQRACGGADLSPREAADLGLIRQSAGSEEPGGG